MSESCAAYFGLLLQISIVALFIGAMPLLLLAALKYGRAARED